MATNNSLKDQLIEKGQSAVNVQETMFKNLMNSDEIKSKFTEVLKHKATGYMNSIIRLAKETPTPNVIGVSDSHQITDLGSLLNETPTPDVVGVSDSHKRQAFGSLLMECEPRSIIDACMIAASLDLPVDKNLDYVWIIPYKKKANFGLEYKGYIQLLLRTGEYKAINVIEVYEGQLKSWNPLAEEFDIDVAAKKSNAVIGYAGYFEMLNGFRKSVYWSKENMDDFRDNNFKTDIRWNSDYKAMAKRTVMRNMISKWGSLSDEMQKAYYEDLNTDKLINN